MPKLRSCFEYPYVVTWHLPRFGTRPDAQRDTGSDLCPTLRTARRIANRAIGRGFKSVYISRVMREVTKATVQGSVATTIGGNPEEELRGHCEDEARREGES